MATYSSIIGRGVETLRLIVTQGSQSTSGNYSNVNWRLEIYSPRSPWSNYSSSWSVNIGGVTRSGTRSSYNFGSYSTLVLGSGSVRINHNSNGTKSINSSASYSDPNGTIGSGSVSGGPLTLTTIARASTISSVSNVSINDSNSVSVGIARQSSSFTHDVKFTIGSRSHTITGVGTSTSYVIPTSWLDQLSNVTSRSGTVQLTTKSGSTTIGTTSTSFTASVPSNVTPSVGTVTTSLTSPSYPSEWGLYVQGKSSVRVNVSGATPGTGSGLKSIAVTVRGATKTRSTNGYLDFPLSQSGETIITTVVTDDRNRSKSSVATIYVEPYGNPRIVSMDLERVDHAGTPDQNGGYGLVYPVFNWDSLSGNNPASATVQYKQRTSSTWIEGGSPTSGTPFVFGSGNISPNNTYDVRLRVTDYFGFQVESLGVISSAEVIVDFKAGGKGMGIGKVSEQDNLLEVEWPAQFNNGAEGVIPAGVIVPFAGSEVPDGWLLCDGSMYSYSQYPRLKDAIGSTYGIGLNQTGLLPDLRTRVPVGRSASDSDFGALGNKGGAKTHTLTVAQMPSHNHKYFRTRALANESVSPDTATAYGTLSALANTKTEPNTFNTGGNQAHNNLQPYIVLNYIIKY